MPWGNLAHLHGWLFWKVYLRKNTFAGWSFVAFRPESEILEDLAVKLRYGPVHTAQTSKGYIGAEKATNNTGELTAGIETIIWLLEEVQNGGTLAEELKRTPIAIHTDSRYLENYSKVDSNPKRTNFYVI